MVFLLYTNFIVYKLTIINLTVINLILVIQLSFVSILTFVVTINPNFTFLRFIDLVLKFFSIKVSGKTIWLNL